MSALTVGIYPIRELRPAPFTALEGLPGEANSSATSPGGNPIVFYFGIVNGACLLHADQPHLAILAEENAADVGRVRDRGEKGTEAEERGMETETADLHWKRQTDRNVYSMETGNGRFASVWKREGEESGKGTGNRHSLSACAVCTSHRHMRSAVSCRGRL